MTYPDHHHGLRYCNGSVLQLEHVLSDLVDVHSVCWPWVDWIKVGIRYGIRQAFRRFLSTFDVRAATHPVDGGWNRTIFWDGSHSIAFFEKEVRLLIGDEWKERSWANVQLWDNPPHWTQQAVAEALDAPWIEWALSGLEYALDVVPDDMVGSQPGSRRFRPVTKAAKASMARGVPVPLVMTQDALDYHVVLNHSRAIATYHETTAYRGNKRKGTTKALTIYPGPARLDAKGAETPYTDRNFTRFEILLKKPDIERVGFTLPFQPHLMEFGKYIKILRPNREAIAEACARRLDLEGAHLPTSIRTDLMMNDSRLDDLLAQPVTNIRRFLRMALGGQNVDRCFERLYPVP